MRITTGRGRWWRVAGVFLAAGLLGACADDPGGPGEAPEPPAPTSIAPVPHPSEVTPAPQTPTRTGPQPVTEALTGQVVAGVTAGCKLLATDRGEYVLTGPLADDLRVGDTVTVRGEVRTDVGTICQQGAPFEVTEVLD